MEELIRALKSLMVSARAERGLVGCNLYQQVENQTELCYVENWQTEDDAESQMRSNRYTRLLALMETAAEPPSLEIHTVSRTQGLDYLQEVRSGLKA